jgi:transposase-like protein
VEFKLRALEKLEKKSAAQVAHELAIPYRDILYRWRTEKGQLLEALKLRKPSQLCYQSQLTLLKRDLRRAIMERDILKKAVSYFARQQRRSANSSSRTDGRHQ